MLKLELCATWYVHNYPWKFQTEWCRLLGGDRSHTHTQTDRQTDHRNSPPLSHARIMHTISFLQFFIPKPRPSAGAWINLGKNQHSQGQFTPADLSTRLIDKIGQFEPGKERRARRGGWLIGITLLSRPHTRQAPEQQSALLFPTVRPSPCAPLPTHAVTRPFYKRSFLLTFGQMLTIFLNIWPHV